MTSKKSDLPRRGRTLPEGFSRVGEIMRRFINNEVTRGMDSALK